MDFNIADITGKTLKLVEKTESTLKEIEKRTGLKLRFEEIDNLIVNSKRKLKIVFIGQYSSGKSSIIKMLTGNEQIEIGAGITTQSSQSYGWEGMEIFDTPGIMTGIRPDHDAITYRAIAQADLLVYVITNEGFDSNTISNFKKIAYDIEGSCDGKRTGKGKFNEMILVVNKMARIGNDGEKQRLISEDIKKLLPDNETDFLRVCFLDAESYLDSKVEDDEEIVELLYQRSGYESFINNLNDFAQEKGLAGRLVSPLQQLESALKDNIEILKGSTGDPHADGANEVLKSALNEMKRIRRRGEKTLNDIFNTYAMEIRGVGQDVVSALGTESAQMVLDNVESRLQDISSRCQDEIDSVIKQLQIELDNSVDCIINGEFAQSIQNNIGEDNNGEAAQRARETFDSLQRLSSTIIKNLDAGMIKTIGHLFGKKFKPWEAVKYMKWFKGVDKYLPVIGQVLDIAIELWDRKKREEAMEALRNAQYNATSTFNTIASEFQRDGMQAIREGFLSKMDELVEQQEEIIHHLDVLKRKKSDSVLLLEEFIRDSEMLMRDIRRNS